MRYEKAQFDDEFMVKSNKHPLCENDEYVSLDIMDVKFLTKKFLNKRDLSLSQILRLMRKYDPELTIGCLERAILELLITDEIEELSADFFCLVEPNGLE